MRRTRLLQLLVVSGLLASCQSAPITVTVRTVSPPGLLTGSCGGFNWPVELELSDVSTQDGWIVQEIVRVTNVTPCAGGAGMSTTLRYWEAWWVPSGHVRSALQKVIPVGHDDAYGGRRYPGTRGSVSVEGMVAFFAGVTLPPDMTINNTATQAGLLFSSLNRPPFWNAANASRHALSIAWDCCGAIPSRTVTTDPITSETYLGAVVRPPPFETGTLAGASRAREVVALLEKIPPWVKEGGYTTADSKALVAAGKELAKLTNDDLRVGVASFLEAHRADAPTPDDLGSLRAPSQVFLALRVIFDVPRAARGPEAKRFGGWVGDSDPNGPEGFSVLWPVDVDTRGALTVKGAYAGYMGVPYGADLELEHFIATFPRRAFKE
jgi:hypothetical protein